LEEETRMRLGTVTGSSLIKKVGFLGSQASQGTLRIEFYDTTLDFQKVPYQILRGLVTAKDKSAYYFKHIYGKFDYKEI